MKVYIKKKVFSWTDKFRVFDSNENDIYTVEGEFFTIGKKLHVYDSEGNECANIIQKVLSFLPRYFININGEIVAEIVKKFTLLRHEYAIEGFNWSVTGNFFAHEYDINKGNEHIATVSKKWFSWGDSYEIDIDKNENILSAVCVVIIVDAVMSQSSNTSGSYNN